MKRTIKTSGGFDAEQLNRLRSEAANFLALSRVPGPEAHGIVSVIDEVAGNILEHGKATWLQIDVETTLERVNLHFRDDGKEFDPVETMRAQAALQPGSSEERKLGLYMLANMGENHLYLRTAGVNELTLTVPLEASQSSSANMSVEIEKGGQGRPWRVKVVGKVDVFSYVQFKQKLEQIMAEDKAARIVVDLSQTLSVASSGWSVLLGRRKLMRPQGGDLALCGMSAELMRVYKTMRVAPLLPAAADFEAAAKLMQENPA